MPDPPTRRVTTLIGIFNDGKAITVAKNIPFKKTYPFPTRIKQITGSGPSGDIV